MAAVSASFLVLLTLLTGASASFFRTKCPWNWSGNPTSCDLKLCEQTGDCVFNGKSGICCQTTCGGQNCHFQSVRINRQVALVACPAEFWLGPNPQQCAHHACDSDEQCKKNGTQGQCCVTRCGGRVCHFPAVDHCPAAWVGEEASVCSLNLCFGNNDCVRRDGVKGHCCMTKCSGRNCHYPATAPIVANHPTIIQHNNKTRRRRSADLECDPEIEYCDEDEEDTMHKRSTRGADCPADWLGILGKCARHQCVNGTNCTLNDQDGVCCRTKCGGLNCHVPNQFNPRDVNVMTGFCPTNWRGLNASECGETLCNNTAECRKKDLSGHCCQTSCGGRNCHYPPKPIADSALFGRFDRIAMECPDGRQWPGTNPSRCSVKTCSMNSECWSWADGSLGLCCPTKCSGGFSCFNWMSLSTFPVNGRNSNTSGLKKIVTIAAACPERWTGVSGTCGRRRCEEDVDCFSNNTQGLHKNGHCCPTLCGGQNCYFPSAVRTKRELAANGTSENEHLPIRKARSFGSCPWKWFGQIGRCRENVCVNSNNCPRQFGKNGKCCRTICGANNCYYSLFN